MLISQLNLQTKKRNTSIIPQKCLTHNKGQLMNIKLSNPHIMLLSQGKSTRLNIANFHMIKCSKYAHYWIIRRWRSTVVHYPLTWVTYHLRTRRWICTIFIETTMGQDATSSKLTNTIIINISYLTSFRSSGFLVGSCYCFLIVLQNTWLFRSQGYCF